MSSTGPASALGETFRVFLRIGCTAFGGPAAHVAMMEDELVQRRGWVTRERFLDLLGATQLIPGPNSTELALHLGRLRAGWPGFFAAGACFVLPAALASGTLAWMYLRVGMRPEVAGILMGIKPVVLAVVAQAIWRLGRTAVRSVPLALLGTMALVATLAGVPELAVLAGAALLAAALRPVPAGVAHVSAWPIFLVFAKVGALLFGSGYVLLAFLRTELVTARGWLTEAQLLDAFALAQVTPGPVFTTSTFAGYVAGGVPGAVAATVGVFLPAFVLVALSGPLVPHLRASRLTGAVLDGVNVASLGLMAAVAVRLAGTAVTGVPTLLIALAAAVALLRFRVHTALLLAGGALAGLVLGG